MRKHTLLFLFPAVFAPFMYGQSFVNGQAARAVIGQSTFSAGISNAQAYVLGGANAIAYGNGYLWIADSNKLGYTPSNNRVLLFGTGEIPKATDDITSFSAGDSQCHLCGFSAFNVLGQPDFVSTNPGRGSAVTPPAGSASGNGYMYNPTGVATDGTVLAVADTDNNRILIWNSLPLASAGIPPNIVLGQADFNTGTPGTSQTALKGPAGLWIQNGKLFVADTSNSRVLIWNTIPTRSNQPADLVLGQPDFNSSTQPHTSTYTTAANQLVTPTSVTSDGTRLYVADEGSSRILIWNTIPTTMDQPADIAVGQPDLTSSVPNNPAICPGNGPLCQATLSFPAYALSDGHRLFVADTGDDRVLIFNTIPTANAASADLVLGQPDFTHNVNSSQSITITSTTVDNTGAVDTIPSPTSLAWDGSNLYVTDPSNRRVLMFSPADTLLPDNSVLNWASEVIRQEGIVTVALTAGGAITAGDTATITIQGTNYTYTVVKADTLDSIAEGLVNAINSGSGDPNATAIFAGVNTGSVYLSSKGTGLAFDSITLAATESNSGNLTLIPSGGYLTSGTAATGSAAMLVEIDGSNLSDQPTSNPAIAPLSGTLPTSLGGSQVFMDGIATPILSASSTQIITQVPYFFTNGTAASGATSPASGTDRNSTSVYVRTTHSDGSVTITNATPLYIAPANPGLFNAPGYAGQPRPWPAVGALHQPGNATAVVSIDGTANAGDTSTITVNGRSYSYTEASGDTLTTVVTNLVNQINNDAQVTAAAGGAFNRVVITARASGADGVGIPITASATSTGTADVVVTAYTSSTCCNVTPGSAITPANPAVPGELITLSAAGLGVLSDDTIPVTAGQPYNGSATNSVSNSVDATMGGSTAQVVSAGFAQGSYGMYQVQLIVPSSLSANANTQVYIAQNAFISNTVTIPVGAAVQAAPPGVGLAASGIIISPANLVFANQNLGNAATAQTVTIYNPGSAPLTVNSIQLGGASPGAFTLVNDCGTSLAAQSSCTATVTYNTGASAINTATLVVYDSTPNSPHTVSLTGTNVSSFEIINKLSGKALDVTGESTALGAVIQQFTFLSGRNQEWTFVPVGGGYFAIMNVNSGLVLDVTLLSTADGAVIQQWQYVGGDNQKWSLQPTADGYYSIVNLLSGKVLDVTGFSTVDGAVIQQYTNLNGDNQKWQILPIQYYAIENLESGSALDVTGFSLIDSSLVQQYHYLGGANQQWQLIPVDNLYFKIVNRNSGKVLDVVGQSTADGANIQQFDYLGLSNQQWAFLPTDVSGYFAISNKNSGRVLDVTGESTADGTLIQQYDYLGGPNQKWRLVPVQ